MNDETAGSAWLEQDDKSRVELTGNCSIGRMQDNDLVLADEKVSRHHALLQQRLPNEYWLIDLGSSNGTFVNQRRLRYPTLLQNGDSIGVGSACLHFRQTGAAELTKGSISTVFHIRPVQAWLLVTDIVNSSQLQKRLPPEQARTVTHAFMNRNRVLVDNHNGMVNQFLGDGVFAYWVDSGDAGRNVSAAVLDLRALRREGDLEFRMALHFGKALLGGGVLGEENLHGPDVNYVFRMEKLAKRLEEVCLLSEPAAARLQGHLPTQAIGRHSVPDFDGDMLFHRVCDNP